MLSGINALPKFFENYLVVPVLSALLIVEYASSSISFNFSKKTK